MVYNSKNISIIDDLACIYYKGTLRNGKYDFKNYKKYHNLKKAIFYFEKYYKIYRNGFPKDALKDLGDIYYSFKKKKYLEKAGWFYKLLSNDYDIKQRINEIEYMLSHDCIFGSCVIL